MARSASQAERSSPVATSRAGTSALAAVLHLAVAAWMGAVVFFSAVVAPAAFRILPSRALAGQLTGEALPVLFVGGIIIAGAVLLRLVYEARRAGRLTVGPFAAASVMLVSLFTAQFIIGSRIAALRARAGGALDHLPAGDPLRQQFGALHGLSVLALGIGAAAAVALLFLLRARHERT